MFNVYCPLNGYTSCCCCLFCCCWNLSNWQLHTAYINIRVNTQALVTLYRRRVYTLYVYRRTHGGFLYALSLSLFVNHHNICTEIVYYKRVVCACSIHIFLNSFFWSLTFSRSSCMLSLVYCLMQLYSFTSFHSFHSTFFHLSLFLSPFSP